MDPEVLTFATAREAAEACGARTFELLEEARFARGIATLAVSGGNTPRVMFEWMARQPFDWDRVELFWVDERCVPPDDEQSNYKMTRLALLDHAPILPAQIHRIQGELPPEVAARIYVDEVRKVLGDEPVFDVIQRGMGPDGHTASLFPGEPLIADEKEIATALRVEKMKQYRVTLLRGVLERARGTLVLATGAEKAEVLRKVLDSEYEPLRYPSQIRSPETVWYTDRAAMGLTE